MAAAPQTEPQLLKAFAVFEQQCEQLERTHRDLRRKLDRAQLKLEEKNRELACRVVEIEQMRERLARILESITDAVFLVDHSGNVTVTNRAAEELLGAELDKGGLAGLPQIACLLGESSTVKDRDVLLDVEGRERSLLVSVTPMSPGEGAMDAHVVAAKDVTENRRLQERVAREDRLAALGQVAASVAHEIRNPLGAIEGFARLLRSDLADAPDSRRLAEKISHGARQLDCVVNNLLNYAREMRCDYQRQDLRAVVDDVMGSLQPMADGTRCQLSFDRPSEPLVCEIDSVLVRQVVANLVVNAIEACRSRREGCVRVQACESDSTVYCTVVDNGCGIPPDMKERILEPFVTHKKGGIGLGLALSQRIAEMHGGGIEVDSEPGEGARFVLTLRKDNIAA